MPPGTLTFTGPIGPGRNLAAKVFNNVIAIEWKLGAIALQVVQAADNPQGNYITHLDIAAITTITHTITAGVHSITVT